MFMGLSLSHIFLSMRMKSIEISLRARATDMVVLYFQKGASVLGQNTFFDVLKYVAAQPPSHKSQSGVDQMHYYSFFFCQKFPLNHSLFSVHDVYADTQLF
jgi:receptor expression-enhancing protein 1/2/3/4